MTQQHNTSPQTLAAMLESRRKRKQSAGVAAAIRLRWETKHLELRARRATQIDLVFATIYGKSVRCAWYSFVCIADGVAIITSLGGGWSCCCCCFCDCSPTHLHFHDTCPHVRIALRWLLPARLSPRLLAPPNFQLSRGSWAVKCAHQLVLRGVAL